MPGTILLFGHVDSADTVNRFLADLTLAFHDLGRPAILTMLGNGTPPALPHEAMRHPGSFAIDVNSKIHTGDFPKLSLVVDHPVSHPRLLQTGTRTVLGLIDQGHCRASDYLRAPAAFIPHGGPNADASALEGERDIDVLFVGNILDATTALDESESVALAVGSAAARGAIDPFPSLVAALGSRQADELARLLNLATDEAQRCARLAALSSIRQSGLHVVGHVPEDVAGHLPDGCVRHGFNRSFTESLALMRRSKVVINVSQKFPEGSHERIWYGMAAGAALISNRSTFVEQDFTHGESILFYDDPRQVGDLVDQALRANHWRDVARAALPAYQAGHTWLDRAERILVAMIGRV
ncbi:glycosyltransferase [Paramagnetospirillum marisnigri]|uniref:glycosyltransferase n=1 Tax=Paramagnetospirillum marisnigri TaxID=1285242 RepID=UPI000838133E|nr:glycosyltransferase [Paramagnetospirillum marisnigri]